MVKHCAARQYINQSRRSGLGIGSVNAYPLLRLTFFCALFTWNDGVRASCVTHSGMPICCRGRQPACSSKLYDHHYTVVSSHFNYSDLEHTIPNKIQSMKTCYCDEHCTLTGDCCPDYRELCHKPVIDCVVSAWGAWGPCNRACGQGIRFRTRKVVKPSQNGGNHCPVLKETTQCEGYRCGSRRVSRSGSKILPYLHRAQNEIAHLLPKNGDVIRMIRQWNMRWDVRRKLYLGRLIKQNKTEQPEPEPYCAVYQITHTTEGCQYESGRTLSTFEQMNRYTYPLQWIPKRSTHHRLQTQPRNQHGVLFGRNSPFSAHSSGMVLSNIWKSKVINLVEGQAICITCYPGYMREDLGMRCSGTGLMNVETRWRALRTIDCHGKFRMISVPQRSCTCGKSTNSFIFV